MSLILASASPRRADLLKQAGLSFTISEPGIDEHLSFMKKPGLMVEDLAREKALATTGRFKSGFVLAADTLVILEGLYLGKPVDEDDARRMLFMLSGKVHEVFTGLALLNVASGKMITNYAKTKVWMKLLEEEQVERYLKTGEPFDKAGAYGIQGRGAMFIDKIEGCYFNVVGLPLSLLYEMLKEMKVPTWITTKESGHEK